MSALSLLCAAKWTLRYCTGSFEWIAKDFIMIERARRIGMSEMSALVGMLRTCRRLRNAFASRSARTYRLIQIAAEQTQACIAWPTCGKTDGRLV
jgi:hypothetical protein